MGFWAPWTARPYMSGWGAVWLHLSSCPRCKEAGGPIVLYTIKYSLFFFTVFIIRTLTLVYCKSVLLYTVLMWVDYYVLLHSFLFSTLL